MLTWVFIWLRRERMTQCADYTAFFCICSPQKITSYWVYKDRAASAKNPIVRAHRACVRAEKSDPAGVRGCVRAVQELVGRELTRGDGRPLRWLEIDQRPTCIGRLEGFWYAVVASEV